MTCTATRYYPSVHVDPPPCECGHHGLNQIQFTWDDGTVVRSCPWCGRDR